MQRLTSAVSQRAHVRHNSGFIRSVMEQVRRDAQNDPKLKKAFKDLEQSGIKEKTQDLAQAAKLQEEKLRMGAAAAAEKTNSFFSKMKSQVGEQYTEKSSKFDQMAEENEQIKQAREYFAQARAKGAVVGEQFFGKAKGVFGRVMDASSSSLKHMEDQKQTEKLKKWQEAKAKSDSERLKQQEIAKKAEEDPEFKAKMEEQAAKEAEAKASEVVENGLVVSHESTWDRFGTRVRDMPFLNSFYDNPLFDRVLGETEIAQSIREMREHDSSFRLAQFVDEVEQIIVPHVLQSYLDGDDETLQIHCGEAAFAAVNASIKERKRLRLTLDNNILSGPHEVELKGAKTMDGDLPSFIFTFHTQQINCLRDAEGEVVEGGVDDIRAVHYAIVVRKHPEVEETLGLLYPWQVSELAIVGTQACW